MEHCQSCGMPLSGEAQGGLCQYCVDENGNLKPREEVQTGISEWLKQWAKEEGSADFMKRADNYLKAMPAWADK